jgi:NADH-quinone oxidoreductase subunit N
MIFFSIAGIPPMAGFYSKLAILLSLVSQGFLVTSLFVVIFSSIACFYYIKLIKIFFFVNTMSSGHFVFLRSRNTEVICAALTLFLTLFLAQPNLLLLQIASGSLLLN